MQIVSGARRLYIQIGTVCEMHNALYGVRGIICSWRAISIAVCCIANQIYWHNKERVISTSDGNIYQKEIDVHEIAVQNSIGVY
jgi:hypothetical protein